MKHTFHDCHYVLPTVTFRRQMDQYSLPGVVRGSGRVWYGVLEEFARCYSDTEWTDTHIATDYFKYSVFFILFSSLFISYLENSCQRKKNKSIFQSPCMRRHYFFLLPCVTLQRRTWGFLFCARCDSLKRGGNWLYAENNVVIVFPFVDRNVPFKRGF